MKIVTNQYGQVNFNFPSYTKDDSIALSISGGADSALLLHLIIPILQDTKCNWKIVTGGDTARPWSGPAAKKIVKLVFEHHGVNSVIEHRFYGYNTTILSESDCQTEGVGRLVLENEFNYLISGTTALPDKTFLYVDTPGHPLERTETKSIQLYDVKVLPNGNACNLSNMDAGVQTGIILKQWRPFANVHKKWIAEEYEKLSRQYPEYCDFLFNTSISCVSYAEHTNNFTKPCTYCWWCKEKEWAFGCYDAGYRD